MRIPASGRHLDHHHMPPRLAVSAENTCGQHPEQFRTSSDSVSNSFEPVPNSSRAQEGGSAPLLRLAVQAPSEGTHPFLLGPSGCSPSANGPRLGQTIGEPVRFLTVRNRFGMGSELARNRFGTVVRDRFGTASEPVRNRGSELATPSSVRLRQGQ